MRRRRARGSRTKRGISTVAEESTGEYRSSASLLRLVVMVLIMVVIVWMSLHDGG